jgi:hypothetical protein
LYARARKLVSAVEFQLQQLEDGRAGRHGHVGLAAVESGEMEDDPATAVTRNINLLFQATQALERAVADEQGQKKLLWRR